MWHVLWSLLTLSVSSIFNSLLFSLFTTDSIFLSQNTNSSIPFHQPLLEHFIHNTEPLDLQVDTSIINPRHSIPEPQLDLSNTCFLNDLFGIPFQDKMHIIHIRVPQPSKILSLHNLRHLIPLYRSILSKSIIGQLVLYILPSCFTRELTSILPIPILNQSVPSSQHKYISHCFHL